ncbi:MAG: DNA polymerase III subunit chi [Alphaproteobacteria bacterium]
MAEALFYQLESRPLEDVLPGLLEKTRERGQRAVVRVGNAERLAALDAHLWTYSESAFLGHGTAADGHAELQPVYLTTEDENPNSAEVIFFVGGALPEDWTSDKLKAHLRVVVLFDGRDAAALESARLSLQSAIAAGFDSTFWKQVTGGKWEKQDV